MSGTAISTPLPGPPKIRCADSPAEVAGAARGPGGARRPGGSRAWLEGFEAGVRAYRVGGRHEVPGEHPRGSTEEGRDWFRGCCAGLERCEAIFQGHAGPTKPKNENNDTR